nr:DUF2017 family protein [Leucobacter edaphi]
MRPVPGGSLVLILDGDEAGMLDQLVVQLIQLLQSHSGTSMDPDPLFASLEVGGTEETPDDPALARLFPDAFEDEADASRFRRVSEQGLLNRKLQDAFEVTSALGVDTLRGFGGEEDEKTSVEVEITPASLPAWVRTVTALRLAIAARIGLESDADHARLREDEETRGTVLVFDWLAAILESVLAIMVGRDGSADTA